jgi:pimeloyl-ACP methyl ester carboxylesterase
MLGLLFIMWTVFAKKDPDASADFAELAQLNGYNVETHFVTTKDGYILTVFRIPGKVGEVWNGSKPVAILQHGLIDSSDTWITNDEDLAPGFKMVDAGYDVWFGNSRGNRYSQGHTSLKPSKATFWQFTWQHMASYDLPAFIDYVLAQTGKPKLVYIGHSQGTLQMTALLSEQPEYADKLYIYIALAPIGSVIDMDVMLLNLAAHTDLVNFISALGIDEFLSWTSTGSNLIYDACKVLDLACTTVDYLFLGMTTEYDNKERFPVIFAHEPCGTSTLNMKHWSQMVNYKEYKMQKFDYGEKQNMAVYGSAQPPLYDLSKIRAKTALFFGLADRLGDPRDGAWMIGQMDPKTIVYQRLDVPAGHMTFVWGKEMSYFDEVIDLARKYSV